MSAPPLFRFVDERRVSVVRDAAAVRQVLDADPVGSCMVASRVAEHGVDPSAIGGELWTRGSATESLCYAGANLIPLRGEPADLYAFADKAVSAAPALLVAGRSRRAGAADVAPPASTPGGPPATSATGSR